MSDEQQQERIARIERELATLVALPDRVERLEISMYGNDQLKVAGVLTQLQRLASALDDLVKDKARERAVLVGIGIGLGLTSVGTIGTWVTLAQRVAGLP